MVAVALHQLGWPDLLEDSELVAHFGIHGGGGYWSRGRALGVLLARAAQRVSDELSDVASFAERRSLLDAVVSGQSIARWAREHGRTRAAVSRGMWREVCELVADEAGRLALLPNPTH